MQFTLDYLRKHWITLTVIFLLGWLSVFMVFQFVDISRDMLANEFDQLDQEAASLALAMRNDTFTTVMHIVTNFGNWYAFLGIFIILSIIIYQQRNHLKSPLISVAIITGASVVMYFLKEGFGRERPTLDTLVEASLSSFPSGHSMLSVVFYGFVIFYIWTVSNSRLFQISSTAFFIVLIVLICWSRIYLGAHFASDVLAGIVAGVGWLSTSLLIYLIIRLTRKKEGQMVLD
ncbi:phosphatase PAP2 family protein [Marinoscillum pacificum]|uniref:phosphatase PAP2 family protein n=1 Tax=Marinoscillum pacificum TaxID=392723 RepID=UPI002157143A|nr:phosphatase PAP2 family protein [Marinoscillum pacificum]